MSKNIKVRVRYAPSPTGNLHIGGARSALFNYLYAKKVGGKFIVRIEDTDVERNVVGGEDNQIDGLAWLGVIANESPRKAPIEKYGFYRQSQKLDRYVWEATKLIEAGEAYYCFCQVEELEQSRQEQSEAGQYSARYDRKCANLSQEEIETKLKTIKPVIRIRAHDGDVFEWDDIVRGKISFRAEDFGDWIVVKSNGIATYNFAVVIDDLDMQISHIMRGEEHISNTPKQLCVYKAMKKTPPMIGHVSLITGASGKKLSKRDETTVQFIQQYKQLGYLPIGVFNFLALLGWSPTDNVEIMTKEEIISKFELSSLSKAPSFFDTQKMNWVNGEHIKRMSDAAYFKTFKHFVTDNFQVNNSPAWLKRLILLFKDQIKYGQELVECVKFIFEKIDLTSEDEALRNLEVEKLIKEELSKIKKPTIEAIDAAIKNVGTATGLKGKELFIPIRIAITGQSHGPSLKELTMLILEKK